MAKLGTGAALGAQLGSDVAVGLQKTCAGAGKGNQRHVSK